jgi:cardiolipin synthase
MPHLFSWSLGHLFSILNFLLAVLFVSFILRSKRPPGNTLAWLLFVLIIPYVAIPLFIFLTDRKYKTRLQKKKALYELNPQVIPQWEGSVEKLLGGMGVPPAKGGHQANLLASGEEAYAQIAALISSAQSRVHLTTFIFAEDPVAEALIFLLEKKAEEGVQVRILLDSLGSLMARHASFKGLRAKGGQVVFFNPVLHTPFAGRTNLRNHRKLLIVDSRRAIMGGMNIAKEYMGPGPDPARWTDLCLQLEGPCVRDMEAIFTEDWKFATGKDPGRESPAPAGGAPFDSAPFGGTPHDGECALQIIPSGPDVRWDPLYDTLLSLIFQARQRVWIATPYFIPDESLTRALELAGRRGIDVRLLAPRKSNHFLADLARGTYLRQLLNSGCRIALAEKMLHAKAFLVDGDYAILGSANFDMRSLLLNYEIGVLIRSGQPLASLDKWFREQFQAAGKSDFKVNYWRDLLESVGRVFGPLI